MPRTPSEQLQIILEHPYQTDVCFVCAAPLSAANRTEEHIFPRWLQDRFDLRAKRLTLANRTEIRYDQLKIPCCFDCNNQRLSPLENRIARASANGFNEVVHVARFDLFRWLAKIYLGIQYKELSLLVDRRNPEAGGILTAEWISRYALLHLCLTQEQLNGNPEFTPGSLWIFRCQVPDDIVLQFDLADDIQNGVIAIRFGEVAILADFLDDGHHQDMGADMFRRVSQVALHPLQFKELVAIVVYQAKLINIQGNVEFFEHGGRLRYRLNYEEAETSPWVQEDYARILAFYTGIAMELLYEPLNSVRSLLHDQQMNVINWPFNEPHPITGACWPDLI